MANIYLELELFLDPPITDSDVLKKEINGKISNWNKMLNADPENKIRVSKAKHYLAQGLSNLHDQASAARKEKLQALQGAIKKAGRVGGINEIKLKKLKSTYRFFFTETTIINECGGASSLSESVSKLPKFLPPKCPDLFVCSKQILFREMQSITDDLELVKNGNYKNLYDLLEVSPSVNREELYTKAQELAERARKMPKARLDADSMNRLSGKCINFFKDDQNRKSYDVALKRFPFDELCADEFEYYIDKEEGIPWDIWQESIHKTIQKGLTQEEAEWLVYEFYCVTNKCPLPIPETNKPTQPVQPAERVEIDYVNAVTKIVGQSLGQFSEKAKNWYKKVRTVRPVVPPEKAQQSQPKSGNLQKILDGLRKKFSRQKNPSVLYLNGLFEELNAIVTQYQTAPVEMIQHVKFFQAEVAERLGDHMYSEKHFGSASHYYQMVLDCMPQHAKAHSRLRMIDNIKENFHQQVQITLSQKDFLACKQSIEELKAKFSSDSEIDSFVRKTEDQIQVVSTTRGYIQHLIDENRWYALADFLENSKQPAHMNILHNAKKRLAGVEKNILALKQLLHKGSFEHVRQQLIQVKKQVADHPKYDAFVEEAKEFRNHVQQLDAKFKELIEKKQLIKAENKLREFLVTYPEYKQGLVGHAQFFAEGVTRFQNGIRFWLFTVFGGGLFIIVSLTLWHCLQENFVGNTKMGIVLALGLGFLLARVVYSLLIRFFFAVTKTPFLPGGFGLSHTVILFTITSAAGYFAFTPAIAETVVQYIVQYSESLTAAENQGTWVNIFRFTACWFFFYLLHVYIFSFYNCCMEVELPQPVVKSWIISTILAVQLKTIELGWFEAGPLVQKIIIHPFTVSSAFWVFTALVAYFHLRNDMSTFSIADVAGYHQRNILLHRYSNTDFDKPLLLTDWYQKAIDHAQRQTQ